MITPGHFYLVITTPAPPRLELSAVSKARIPGRGEKQGPCRPCLPGTLQSAALTGGRVQGPRCPECGTERDSRYVENQDGIPRTIECLACEIVRPCCPECGTFKVSRNEEQTKLQCPFCGLCFADPIIPPKLRQFTQDEIGFLVDFGNSLSIQFSKLPSYDEFEYIRLSRRQRADALRYINQELQRFVVVPRLLDWFKTGKKRLPSLELVADGLLTQNIWVRATGDARRRWAKKFMHALRTVAGSFHIQNPTLLAREIILKVVDRELRKGSDYRTILKALNEAPEETQHDPLFRKWHQKHGVKSWYPDVAEKPKLKATFQTFLSRRKKELNAYT